MSGKDSAKAYLDLAARAGARGFGLVEPNPMVGAVIVRDGNVIGIGHHRRFGGLHAERDAINNCRLRGHDPRGATLYCTLEPCCHHGKQPPCTDAVIGAGIAKVVIAQRDPHGVSCGGWEILERAGISVEISHASEHAVRLGEPFLHRVRTGRPWVIAKWAQTLDGRIATRTGKSQWISGPVCRRRVHRLRAKVDAVMVGIGTAIADDPMLTARDCRSVRRVARRVVLDTHGRLGADSKLARTAGEAETIVFTAEAAGLRERLAGTGCVVVETPKSPPPTPTSSGPPPPGAGGGTRGRETSSAGGGGGTGERLDLGWVLETLGREFGVATVLVEAGPRVLGSLLEAELIDEAVVHVAPAVMGDERARAVAEGRDVGRLGDMRRFELVRSGVFGGDVELWYRSQKSCFALRVDAGRGVK